MITHKGDPATAEGISHIDRIRQAADEAVKGTPLAAANIYLTGDGVDLQRRARRLDL
jgi:RND superfamily putative drug exporter